MSLRGSVNEEYMNITAKVPLIRACTILLLTLVVYIPAMRGQFIWDDNLHLTDNLLTRESGLFRSWFTTEQWNYWPLTWTVLWVGWQLWGSDPLGYHVINILLHAGISLLIWRILWRLRVPGAWLAAVIFVVHPVNVQTVAWITQIKNLLAMFFYVIAILAYLTFEDKKLKRWYFCSLLAFLMAGLSKTSVVMLPFVLIACAWWQRGKISREDLMRSLPFFALSGVLGMNEIWFQYSSIGEDVVRPEGFFSRLAGAGWTVWFYFYKALIPYKLSFLYPRWDIDPASAVSYLPAIMLLAFFLLFWRYRGHWGKALLFGLGYFVVTLFPVLGFFDINFMRFSLVADHWQYTSIIGIIALAVGTTVSSWDHWQSRPRKLGFAIATVLVGLLSVFTWVRCHAYRNPEALYRDTIAKNPKAWMAYSNLGTLLASQGKFDEAIQHCYEALRINPTHPWIHGALGNALAEQGRVDEAVPHFYEAVRLKPDFAEAHNDLGLGLKRQNRVDEAISHFHEALKLEPDYGEAHLNLGLTLAEQGRLEQAIYHFSEVVKLAPDSANGHYSLGLGLALQGKADKAISHFSEALRIRPDYAEAHFNLGALLAAQGRLDEAIARFKEVLRIKPDFIQAKQYLTKALNDQRRQSGESNSVTGR